MAIISKLTENWKIINYSMHLWFAKLELFLYYFPWWIQSDFLSNILFDNINHKCPNCNHSIIHLFQLRKFKQMVLYVSRSWKTSFKVFAIASVKTISPILLFQLQFFSFLYPSYTQVTTIFTQSKWIYFVDWLQQSFSFLFCLFSVSTWTSNNPTTINIS